MNKLSLILIGILLFVNCSKKEHTKTYVFDRVDSLYLKKFRAFDSDKTLVFVGFGKHKFKFNGDFINIEKKDFEDLPFDQILRINNDVELNFTDEKGRSFRLKIDSLKANKFIYIEQLIFNHPDSVEIKYCKNHLEIL